MEKFEFIPVKRQVPDRTDERPKLHGNRFRRETPRAAILAMYQEGYSTREVARAFSYGYSFIHKLVQKAGLSRTRRQALVGRLHKPESKHWRTSRSRARRMMSETLNRKLATEEHVHHVDHNFTNNSIANLEIKDPSSHLKEHWDGWLQECPSQRILNPGLPRHMWPARKAYMQAYLKKYRKREKAR